MDRAFGTGASLRMWLSLNILGNLEQWLVMWLTYWVWSCQAASRAVAAGKLPFSFYTIYSVLVVKWALRADLNTLPLHDLKDSLYLFPYMYSPIRSAHEEVTANVAYILSRTFSLWQDSIHSPGLAIPTRRAVACVLRTAVCNVVPPPVQANHSRDVGGPLRWVGCPFTFLSWKLP